MLPHPRVNRLLTGREKRMPERKRENNELCRQLHLPQRYAAPRRRAAEAPPAQP
jgi:hypothetical protein